VTVKVSPLLVTPPAEAVMEVVPGRRPLARPPEVMEAAEVLLLENVKTVPATTFPFRSLAVAVKESMPLTGTDDCEDATSIVEITGTPELHAERRKQSKVARSVAAMTAAGCRDLRKEMEITRVASRIVVPRLALVVRLEMLAGVCTRTRPTSAVPWTFVLGLEPWGA